jgi:hypothetical protein
MVELAEPETKPSRKYRQFGLKYLLLLMLIVAVSIVAWQKLVYVYPAHRNLYYEKAPYTRSGYVNLEHCRIAMESVTRSDRNGTVLTEDGFGVAQTTTPANTQVLKTSGPWLDTAQIELSGSGGTFEVLYARVFDFETRQEIDKLSPKSGARMSDPTTLQFYRLGKKLPDQVDVLLRVLVYEEENNPTTLQPQVGATCSLPGGKLEIREIHLGMQGYNSTTGATCDPRYADSEVALLLTFDGTWPQQDRYQIAVVNKDGKRTHRTTYPSIKFPGGYLYPAGPGPQKERAELVRVSVGIDDISHFELRPQGNQHVFFFEGVQLPKTSTAKFSPPPVATVKIGGGETTTNVPEFEPLELKLTKIKGGMVDASGVGYPGGTIRLEADDQKDFESTTTLLASLHGLSNYQLTLIVNPGPNQKKWIQSCSHTNMDGAYSHTQTFPLPIAEAESVQVKLK